jgi:hypothetical protein
MASDPAGEGGMRSPTLDYAPPAQTTADGHVVGAEGVRPEDKLRMGPRVGTEGVTPSQSPRTIEAPGPVPEGPPCNALGMNDPARPEHCRTGVEPK